MDALLTHLCEQMKKRELFEVLGVKLGIEGTKTDDWQLLDCHGFFIHMMLPSEHHALLPCPAAPG